MTAQLRNCFANDYWRISDPLEGYVQGYDSRATGGFVLGAHVHAASLHDRAGAQRLLTDELKRELPRMELLRADGAYTKSIREWADEERA